MSANYPGPSTSKDSQNDESKDCLPEDFEFDCSECYACGGFYGPSFANPLCATCHAFLYPYDMRRSITMLLPSSGDDNDSGNDEPSDPSPLVAGGAVGGVRNNIGGATGSGSGEQASGGSCSDPVEPSSSSPPLSNRPISAQSGSPLQSHSSSSMQPHGSSMQPHSSSMQPHSSSMSPHSSSPQNNSASGLGSSAVPHSSHTLPPHSSHSGPEIPSHSSSLQPHGVHALSCQSNAVILSHSGPSVSSHSSSNVPGHPAMASSFVPMPSSSGNSNQQIQQVNYERPSSMGSDEDSMDDEDNEVTPAVAYRLNLLSYRQDYHLPPSRPQLFSILSLPPEILLVIFSRLDDLSVWCASRVCAQWCRIIQGHYSNGRWRQFTSERFPLFSPVAAVRDWYSIYSSLVESSCCMQCLFDMKHKTPPAIRESTWRRRILYEVRNMRHEPAQCISAHPLDTDYCLWQAFISGPCGSPYEGGLFYLFLKVPYSYPMEPPQVKFLTRILHPNISRHGDVGIDSITHNWSLALTISKVLVSVQSLLTDPYCQVCMEPEVGRLYMNNRERFNAIAQRWTWKYAMIDIVRPWRVTPLQDKKNDLNEPDMKDKQKYCKCPSTATS